MPDIPGGMEPWAVERWPNAGSVVLSVDVRDPCTTACAAKKQRSGLLYVQRAGQELSTNRVTDTEERVRQIGEKGSAKLSVLLSSIEVRPSLHYHAELA